MNFMNRTLIFKFFARLVDRVTTAQLVRHNLLVRQHDHVSERDGAVNVAFHYDNNCNMTSEMLTRGFVSYTCQRFRDKIDSNQFVVMGHAYSTATDGFNVFGSSTIVYHLPFR